MTMTQQNKRKNPAILKPTNHVPESKMNSGSRLGTPKTMRPVPQPGTISIPFQTEDQPHPMIMGDPKKRKKWDSASDDARFLGQALCELESRINVTGIESYFLFAKTWHERYPKGEKKQYERGKKSVDEGASMSPYSAKQVYSILKTIRTYSWEDYLRLADEATKNGVTIKWTHLRTISDRLGKTECRGLRHEVEEQLVSRQMTEALLNQLIDELTNATGQEKTQPFTTKVRSFLSNLGKNVKQYDSWKNLIHNLESEFQGDSPEEIQTTFSQVEKALEYFDLTAAFMAECRPMLETLHGEVGHLARHLDETGQEHHQAVADRVTDQVRTEKRQGQSQAHRERLTLGDGYNEDKTPIMDSLDDYEGTTGDEFQSDDDIFEEIGNIPEKAGFTSPRRNGT